MARVGCIPSTGTYMIDHVTFCVPSGMPHTPTVPTSMQVVGRCQGTGSLPWPCPAPPYALLQGLPLRFRIAAWQRVLTYGTHTHRTTWQFAVHLHQHLTQFSVPAQLYGSCGQLTKQLHGRLGNALV